MKVLVTGGAGYVGSVLVRKLLKNGYDVSVLDKMIYGKKPLLDIKNQIEMFIGDVRNPNLLRSVMNNVDAVIHLASISNDPSSELNHKLTQRVNYDATVRLIEIAEELNVSRLIYASTSSVYGIKEIENVTEDLPLEPLTIYSKTKAWSEEFLLYKGNKHFTTTAIRSATVCGYSPRMRLDTVVNILTAHAINNNKIIVYGGSQKRPNIHIDDITDLYMKMLEVKSNKIAKQSFNVGFENHTVMEIANMIKSAIDPKVEIEVEPSDDLRSYHISSEKIKRVIGFKPKKTILDAIYDIKEAFKLGKIPNWKSPIYYNIKRMKELQIE